MKQSDQDLIEKQPKEDEQEKSVFIIYIVVLATNILVNFDHGIIPAATKQIKDDLKIDDIELGLLGSVVYAGLLAGSLAASYFFQNVKTKHIIVLSIIAYQLSLALFLITDNIWILGISRTLVGFFQVFLVVFFPVWVDLHGGIKSTLWLTFLQLGVPLGVVIGYCCTGVYISYTGKWQHSFVTQILFLIPCGIAMFLFPEKSINIQGKNSESNPKLKRQNTATEEALKCMGRTSVSPEILHKDKSYFDNLNNLFSNRLFLYTMLCLASLYFVVTGVQFWISDYFQIVLHQPKERVVKYFSLVSITAPTLGVMVGGYVIDKYGGPPEGGYTGQYALDICCISGLLSALSGVPIPYFDDFFTVIALLWLQLFFGGALMPAAMGIMISSIPSELRAFGNSTAQLFSNLLGYLPSPMVYGMVNNYFESRGISQRAGMIMLTCWSFWGVLFLVLGKKFKEKIQQKMELEETQTGNSDQQEMVELNLKYNQQYNDNDNDIIEGSQADDKNNRIKQNYKIQVDSIDQNKQSLDAGQPDKNYSELQQLQVQRNISSYPAANKNSNSPNRSKISSGLKEILLSDGTPLQQQNKLKQIQSQYDDIKENSSDQHFFITHLNDAKNNKQQKKNMNKSGSTGSLTGNVLYDNEIRKTVLKLNKLGKNSLEPSFFMPLQQEKKISQQIKLSRNFSFNKKYSNNNEYYNNIQQQQQQHYKSPKDFKKYRDNEEYQQHYQQQYQQGMFEDTPRNQLFKKKIPNRISYITFAQVMGKANSIFIDTDDARIEYDPTINIDNINKESGQF